MIEIYNCCKCGYRLNPNSKKCPYCGDIKGETEIKHDNLAKKAYDFLTNEDMRLEAVRRELDKISEDRDKFIQKLESLLENEDRETLITADEYSKWDISQYEEMKNGKDEK